MFSTFSAECSVKKLSDIVLTWQAVSRRHGTVTPHSLNFFLTVYHSATADPKIAFLPGTFGEPEAFPQVACFKTIEGWSVPKLQRSPMLANWTYSSLWTFLCKIADARTFKTDSLAIWCELQLVLWPWPMLLEVTWKPDVKCFKQKLGWTRNLMGAGQNGGGREQKKAS